MKIAIIGGGFYGVYFAYKLSQNKKLQIDLFEKNNTLLNETAIRNQYRLHTGYHYPRSLETIYQTFDATDLYPTLEEKAANLLYFVVKNHSFSDGNKRIAAGLFVYFLSINLYFYRKFGW